MSLNSQNQNMIQKVGSRGSPSGALVSGSLENANDEECTILWPLFFFEIFSLIVHMAAVIKVP